MLVAHADTPRWLVVVEEIGYTVREVKLSEEKMRSG